MSIILDNEELENLNAPEKVIKEAQWWLQCQVGSRLFTAPINDGQRLQYEGIKATQKIMQNWPSLLAEIKTARGKGIQLVNYDTHKLLEELRSAKSERDDWKAKFTASDRAYWGLFELVHGDEGIAARYVALKAERDQIKSELARLREWRLALSDEEKLRAMGSNVGAAERAVLDQILPDKNAESATSHSVKTSVTYSGSDAASQKNLEKAAADYRAAMAKEEEEQ